IARRRYQFNPERYEYVLTRKGRDTALLAQALVQIGDKWAVTGNEGPPVRFVDRKSGRRVKLALVDADAGVLVSSADVVPCEGPGGDDGVGWGRSYCGGGDRRGSWCGSDIRNRLPPRLEARRRLCCLTANRWDVMVLPEELCWSVAWILIPFTESLVVR